MIHDVTPSRAGIAAVLAMAAASIVPAQQPQNPSPMVEHTRPHRRLAETRPDGTRAALAVGTLFVPERLAGRRSAPLLVAFHAGEWIPEVAGNHLGMAVISVQLNAGSGGYAAAVEDGARFPSLIAEAQRKAGLRFGEITLAGWSAGCGALRELLRQPEAISRVSRVLAIDGIHTDYADGRPGPLESRIDTAKLEPWVAFAREAMAGRKRLLVLHTEIFPGTFASTTETADYLIRELGLRRRPVARAGPMGTVVLGETRSGHLCILGVAGNSAPDHVDLLHALPDLLRMD